MEQKIKKKKTEGLDAGLGSAFIGGGLFLFFWLVLGIDIVWSAGVGLIGYGAGWGVLAALKNREPEPEAAFDTNYIDHELAKKTAAGGRTLAFDLRGRASQLSSSDPLKPKLSRLCDLIEAIARDVEDDPKDASAAASFLGFQGESALRVATMAIGLAKRGASAAQLTEIREQMNKTMDRMIAAYEKHLAHLQEDNMVELQSELEMLEQSLDMEEWRS